MRVCWHGRAVASFAALAWPLLAADPARHTDALSVLDTLARAQPSRDADVAALLTVHDGAEVVGALIRTAGRPALVSGLRPQHAAAVVNELVEHDPRLPGVIGAVGPAEAVAELFVARAGGSVRVDQRLRLLALGELAAPAGVPGAARLATATDVDLLAEWLRGFRQEAIPHRWAAVPPRDWLLRELRSGDGRLLWEVDGRPVALAAAHRPVAGMSRVGPVYTPPDQRRHGYGAAVTAAAARWATRAGAQQVVLLVDRANPTTNRLYSRLGFGPRHDVVELAFEPPAATAS